MFYITNTWAAFWLVQQCHLCEKWKFYMAQAILPSFLLNKPTIRRNMNEMVIGIINKVGKDNQSFVVLSQHGPAFGQTTVYYYYILLTSRSY